MFAGNSFIDITNTLTGGVNLLLYAGQNPNWNYELMDAIAYGPGKLSDETIYYFQNTSSEQIISDLKDSFSDPATYERALANFMILWVGYKSSVIKNQGNGLEGRNFDFDEVDDFVKKSYDDLSAEGKQVVGKYVDDVSSTTRLWRAVEPDELADVIRHGDYDIHPNSTFKRFAFSEADIDDFIRANPGRSYTKTYIDVPTNKLKMMVEHADPGGVGKAIGIDVYEVPEFYDWFDKVNIIK